jgi:hypothetical protein
MLRDHAEAQLMTIEIAYGISIINRRVVADWIAGAISDREEILLATTYLNTWVALNKPSGDIEIPYETVERVIHKVVKARIIKIYMRVMTVALFFQAVHRSHVTGSTVIVFAHEIDPSRMFRSGTPQRRFSVLPAYSSRSVRTRPPVLR